MQSFKQKSLVSQSNMSTNDGVQIMDLPTRNTPIKAIPSGRSTPLLIPPIKYIVYNNPQAAYDFLINKGYNVDNRIPSVYQFARIYVKEKGEQGILELVRAAHPDKELVLRAMGHKEDSSFCCGFDGKNEEPATANAAAKTDSSSSEAKPESKEKEGVSGLKLNTQTIIIILAIIIFFLLIRK